MNRFHNFDNLTPRINVASNSFTFGRSLFGHSLFGRSLFGHSLFGHSLFGFSLFGYTLYGSCLPGCSLFGYPLLNYSFLKNKRSLNILKYSTYSKHKPKILNFIFPVESVLHWKTFKEDFFY